MVPVSSVYIYPKTPVPISFATLVHPIYFYHSNFLSQEYAK
ncbi:hypothetical protein HMPREF0663_10218 [Hoylesella oralis ATCC 33269]|uniref:Uncharacterized protein n=1 Tax=Hoylesella oralis ATCC 33269 TaxID=873533 RepID=E7RM68_9BACT|nr:hypothetical protein HMPREF0663_10218 [Hoylesella oralis ATCC 33269]